MYEPKHIPLAAPAVFARRLALHAAIAIVVLGGSLGMGMLGYHVYENLPWLDAFLNASMLLGGMGPVNPPQTDGGKLFAGLYALYAGLVFLVTVALVLTPIVHRLMHRFHWNDQ